MATAEYWRKKVIAEGLASFVDLLFLAKTDRDFVWGEHHKRICKALDDVVDGKCKRLIINIAPRYGKTELVSKMFIAYGLALNPKSRFIHLSYSDDLVVDNSRDINEFVRTPAYQALFPYVKPTGISSKKWYTSEGGGVYAVSTAGQVTGFGAGQMDDENVDVGFIRENPSAQFAGAIIIDDPLKPEDANSDIEREKVNARFEQTIRSRTNSRNTPIIIVMQRLHEHDLCGYLQSIEPDEWTVLSLPCITYEGGVAKPLWEFKDTLEELEKRRAADSITFDTQYMQNPTPREGLMYAPFRTYETLPTGSYTIENYTDTADKGSDFLCSICYARFDTAIYVLDVLYTQKPMEFTEPETARMLTRNDVRHAVVESNNGGRGFGRNVERSCRELGNYTTQFEELTQTNNKDARIYTNSAKVTNIVYMPALWETMWPQFAQAIKGYRKAGRNVHDDAPDCLTGCVEMFERGAAYSFGFGNDYD
ncbi:MAG: phage terminase large subunit [Bacteroidales bacterium]|nr:phage terminase large subunit [Candidatus Colicola equi]